jgi:hypothetical protein
MANETKPEIPQEMVLLAEVMIKLAAIEKLCLKAKIFTNEEITTEMKSLSEHLVATMNKMATAPQENKN